MTSWTFDDIPDQTGRTAIVTGANSGIGLETARMLALKGADVVLACRNPEKGADALDLIEAERPAGRVTLQELDLSDLDSVDAFARAFAKTHQRLELLVNNAGLMVPPLTRTKQGFEMQLGTNYLGHFALTLRLLPLLRRTRRARVVVVSSGAHRRGRITFDDLNWERRPYRARAAYRQSKLAALMFALELQRRLASADSSVRVTAAHPTRTATRLRRTAIAARLYNALFGMKPAVGALPTLRAATDPAAFGGTYWVSSRDSDAHGAPVAGRVAERAMDEMVAARLWELSEELTGVSLPITAPAPQRRAA